MRVHKRAEGGRISVHRDRTWAHWIVAHADRAGAWSVSACGFSFMPNIQAFLQIMVGISKNIKRLDFLKKYRKFLDKWF
jgi:hypothetical protein